MDLGELTHFDKEGNAIMVDVTGKEITSRTAIATGKIMVNKTIIDSITGHTVEKGDVLGVARVAGIMAAKQTSSLIPMCHPLPITKCTIDFKIDQDNNEICVNCTTKTVGRTGVEMESLTGVTTALLTIYDMCKAIDKSMVITQIHLVEKSGGKSGDFYFEGR